MPQSSYYSRMSIQYSVCNPTYFAAQECEKQHPIGQIFGGCSEHFVKLRKCILKQLEKQRRENNQLSRERHEKINKKYHEMRESGKIEFK